MRAADPTAAGLAGGPLDGFETPGPLVQIAWRAALAAASFIPKGRRRLRRHLPNAVIEAWGATFAVEPRNNRVEYRLWAHRRPSERRSMRLMLDLVRGRRCLLLDVGANIGVYAVILGAAMAPGSRVVAFEPLPELMERLRRNVALNGLEATVEPRLAAVSDAPGRAMLIPARGNLGNTALAGDAAPRDGAVEATVETLAPFREAAAGYDLFVVKVDTEGFEDRALRPLFEAGEGRRPDLVLVEVDHARRWSWDALGALDALGYRRLAAFEGNAILAAPDFNADRAAASAAAPHAEHA